MNDDSIDPRSIANLLLDLADNLRVSVTHISLQKLLYFAHGTHLIRYHRPLMREGFEAWPYGPVYPALYHIFKSEGARPIRIRAHKQNLISGAFEKLPEIRSPEALEVIKSVLVNYGHLSPGRLVDISHAPNGAWATVANKAGSSIVVGMRIPDRLIAERFRFHKITVGPERWVGELDEQAPVAGDGSRKFRIDRQSDRA